MDVNSNINPEDVKNAEGQEISKKTTLREIIRNKYKIEFVPSETIENVTCFPVIDEDLPELVDLTKRMLNTLTDIKGAGLSGPQIGINKKFFVWWKRDGSPHVAYNPEYYPSKKKKEDVGERCLSYGTSLYKVRRYKEIRAVWYENENNKLVKKSSLLSGDNAIIFQHETDHTKGVTISTKGELVPVRNKVPIKED